MSDNQADSDSGSQIGQYEHEHASNGVSESISSSVAINQVERGGANDGVLGDTEDGKSAEDTTRDDMFVDCPDELITLDSKISDARGGAIAGDDEEGEGEVNQVVDRPSHLVESGKGIEGGVDGYLASEVEHLQHKLEEAVAEKESIVQGYQEERDTVALGVMDLHYQLKALSSHQSLPNEHEVRVREVADVRLEEMIRECLEFMKTASEDQPNTEAAISNLQALISEKDREINDLNNKITQLMGSNESLRVSSETQLEKDRNTQIAVDKMISLLANVVNQEQVLDNSVSEKIFYIEEGTILLIEKYNQILSEIYQLGQSFSELGLGIGEQEYGNILVDARAGLLELKRREAEFIEKLAQLEDENLKLVEELDKERVMIGELNTELGNMKAELEQEKVKSANTKEKLSMAVTKGKALVQQRDSLKTSLAEKSSELEKCLMELQEKSAALEAAELSKEELTQSEIMVESLNNTLLQNNTIFEKLEEILSLAELSQPEMSDIPQRVRWLVDDRNLLKGAYLESCKLKDSLSLMDLPEHISSSDLESQMIWLRDSFHRARNDIYVLQEEISTIKEASCNYIDRLSISFLLELQEKDYLQSELTDLKFKYEELVSLNHQFSFEKDQIVKMLVDLSGFNLEDEGIDQSPSSTSMIIDLCCQKLKDQNGPISSSSYIDADLFERIQGLLYVRDQELMLYEDILEEEMLVRSDMNMLSNELKVASEEIVALKEEKSSLLKDLERSEEKSSMLRDKLSMAVKKGKGLVQDRDNLKGLINEKNSEIEQLKLDLQKQESAVSQYMDQIHRLSNDVQSISKLEVDLLEMKTERNQFEQSLMESNNTLQRVMEHINGITLPVDAVFDEPIEKLKWLAGHVSACQDAKINAEQELQNVKEEASIFETKLAEVQAIVKSLEQGLSSSEESFSQLAGEKTELEREKARVEEELQKVTEKFAEVFSTTKSLEDALSLAEKDISILSHEKEQAQASRVDAETELERVKEEATRQTEKLAEASRTIKDLEDKLSQVEIHVTEKYNADQVVKTDMENELKKLQDEAMNHASKLVDASATIKSLEDALLKAQDGISSLEGANKIAKEEISSLGLKLNSCMDELAGKNGSLETRSVELIGILNDLHVLMKDNILFPRVKQCFERKFETLKDIDCVLNKISGHIVAMVDKDSEGNHMMEEAPLVRKEFLDSHENFEVELESREIGGTDIDTIIASFGKILKGFQLRSKHIADKFDEYSSFVDELISLLHEKLRETETNMMTIVEQMQIMKEKGTNMEKLTEEKENIIAILKNDIVVLLSACTDATSELRSEVDRSLRQRRSISKVENSNLETDEQVQHHKSSKYMEATQNLKNASRKTQTLIKLFERQNELVAETVEDLQNKMKETTAAFEMARDERDSSRSRVLQLESEIQSLQSACSELRNNLEGHHALEEKLKEKEAQISSINSTLLAKEQEAESSLLSASQVRELFDKVDGIEIPTSEGNYMELHTLSPAKKLFHIIDSVTELHHQISSLSHDKEELQSALESKILETKDLKEEVKQLNRNWEDTKMVKNDLSELTFALEKVMDISGASGWDVDRKSTGVVELTAALEKHIRAILSESENLKSKVQDLQSALESKILKIKDLKDEVKQLNRKWEDTKMTKNEFSELTFALEKIMDILGASNWDEDGKSTGVMELISALEKNIRAILSESENSKSKAQDLQSALESKILEVKDLKDEIKQLNRNWEDTKMAKNDLSELNFALEKVMDVLGASDWVVDRKSTGVIELISALEKHIKVILSEYENSKSKAQDLGSKLVGSQRVIDELTSKVKLLEDSHKDRTSQPETVQQRSLFEAPSVSAGSEITEVEEGSLGKNTIPLVASAAHVRNMRKGSTDHLALDINGESDSLIKSADTDDDKGHVFKSLNTSGLVPKQGKLIADRIDGIWVSGGRILMNRPRARLGLIGYLLIVHIWLLATIL